MSTRAIILGTGHAVPQRIMTNHDLEKIVNTSDEWIAQRTGIRQRHVCNTEETSSTLSIEAANKALKAASVDASELDLVICATVTPDFHFPSTSCLIQDAIGAKKAAAFDLGAACAGFIYSLSVASSMIESGQIRTALVVGVDCLTKTLDWTDRSTCVLFGDGAGAVVLRGEKDSARGIRRTVMFADGSGACTIDIEAGGNKYPHHHPEYANKSPYLRMAGAEVYRFAVTAMGDACIKVLEEEGLTPADIDLFVPHQANKRIIDSSRERLGIPEDKVFINVDKYGNTSGGSIPIALDEAVAAGRLQPGMTVLTVGFGAGLVWGANIIGW